MKRKITKIWSIGLIVALLAGMLIAATPASAADPLEWNEEFLPGPANQTQVSGGDIYDFDIAGDGTTIYAVGSDGTNTNMLWKSTDGGKFWVELQQNFGTIPATIIDDCDFVAVAPDDPDVVIVADGDNVTALVTTNGGQTWASLGSEDTNDIIGVADTDEIATAYDLDISSTVSPGIRYVGLAGIDDQSEAAIFYFNLGAASPRWEEATADMAGYGSESDDAFWSIAFSPNFSADYTAVAIGETTGLSGVLYEHVLSFNTETWDAFTGYPVVVAGNTPGSTFTVDTADLGLAPDYVGSDDVSRVVFVALACTENTSTSAGGIYRMEDNATAKALKTLTPMNSVDFNGTDLVAGSYDDNVVYRSADALATTPTVLPSRSNKRIGVDDGGNDQVVVAWNGEVVCGAKQGDASAFSLSNDYGLSWNDLSLIDASLAEINDVYATPDGSVLYVLANDGNETSLYRWKFYKWERILTVDGAADYLLRGAPDDNDVLYVADYGGTAIYFTSDAGENRWYVRAAPSAFTDLAVESADICYIGIGGDIRKSVNSGFTWELAVTPELGGNNVASLTSVAEDQLLVGGVSGYVSYSTDGAETFAKIAKPVDDVGYGKNAYATAASLETGDLIYANTATADGSVWYWEVGWTSADDWQNIGTTLSLTNSGGYSRGITLLEGVLYSTYTTETETEVVRCLNPSDPVGANKWSSLDAETRDVTLAPPTAINVTKGGSNVVRFVDTNVDWTGVNQIVVVYEDTLADTGPEVVSPDNELKNPVNPVTGRSVDVAFNWLRPSVNVNLYDVGIYTDAIGLNTVLEVSVYAPGPKGVVLIGPYQGAGNANFLEWVAGQTYYWRVRVSPRDSSGADMYAPTPALLAKGPIYSQWSAMRSIVIEAGEASVPGILSPAIGGAVTSTTPAFSWSPIIGATLYEFVLVAGSTEEDLAAPIVSAELAVPAYRVTAALTDGDTYFWRVRVIEPVEGPWSPLTSFTVAVPVTAPAPVVIEQVPAPEITITTPPPPPDIVIPPAPAPPAPIAPGYIWAVIIIGAILVIAVIVLIVRTRRTV